MYLLRIAIIWAISAGSGMAYCQHLSQDSIQQVSSPWTKSFPSKTVLSAQPVGPESIDLLAQKCAAGKIDAAFVEACAAVIQKDAAIHSSNIQLPADFFPWLSEHPSLRDDARLALAIVGSKVACNLQILRELDESLVEKYPSLAIAYAASWSKGTDSIPRRYWVDDWLVRGREVPKMTTSFLFHIQQSKKMRVDLQDTPWQILAHLTDSLVPIVERNWAMQRYGKRKTSELRGLFAEVPYTLDPQRGDKVCTLESFIELGGPCTHNVQFAGGVFDSFGIPSGWAGGPGHTYPYWFEVDRGWISIHRTNEIGNRNGKIRNPLGPGYVWEDRLRLLVVALNKSNSKYRRASLAAWAYRRVKEEDRAAASAILPAAIRENSYSFEAIGALTDATRARQLSAKKSGAAWKLVAKAMADRSFVLADFLDRALPAIGEDSPTMDGELALIKSLEKSWSGSDHAWALAKIPLWRARCLAARGKYLMANKIWLNIASRASNADPERFAMVVDAMAKAVPGAPKSEKRLGVLTKMLAKFVPNPRKGWSHLHRSRFLAVRMVLDELILLGREEQAHTLWFDELVAMRGKDPGTGSEPTLVGGSGGGSFLETPANAELKGLRISTAHFNGREVIASVLGIYQVDGKEVIGERAGQQRPGSKVVLAPAGWRIAGMVATGSDRFDGFQLVYVPQFSEDRRVRMSPWFGSRGGREILIGGRDIKIVGIRGRAGVEVDSFGLVGESK